ncbi:MAG: ChaN family lipoprotein [Planctomycetota bacterium]
MSPRRTVFVAALALGLLTAGCALPPRIDLTPVTGGSAALVGQFQAYDGHTGRPLTFAEVARRAARADVILFGEEHSDAVCNQIEAQLLHALAGRTQPIALALEFFESDTQAALDAYLVGRLDESAFREQTRQGRAYVLAHRPLIELCRVAHLSVVAANAPRRLVSAYRKSGVSYEEYRAGIEPADQRWLPATNEYVSGTYEARFFDLMSGHGPAPPTPSPQPATTQPIGTRPTTRPVSMPAPASAPTTAPAMPSADATKSLYWSQLLWDQAMAESLAHFRDRYPTHRVMLIVGSFHVAHTGGTATKFLRRRPHDRVLTVIYRSTPDGRFAFQDDDRHAGDIVVYGIVPPPKKEVEERPAMPAAPTTTQPTTTAPATHPPVVEGGTAVSAVAGPPTAFPRREFLIREALAIGGVGRYGRSAVHTDAVEYQIVTGAWRTPQAGQTVELPDGTVRTWEPLSAGDDGWFHGDALRGGYACATAESDREQVVLLDASGHSLVYVNGEPRTGDPYQNDMVLLPLLLKPGRNELLFACGRGQLRAKLVEPEAPVTFSLRDTTLPDLIVGQEADTHAAVFVVNADRRPIRDGRVAATYAGTRETTSVGPIPALSVRKIGFRIVGPPPAETGETPLELEFIAPDADLTAPARATITLRVRAPHESHRRTFISDIDGSVQYYAVQPMAGGAAADAPPALFLTLHGAGVEAAGQADAYSPKDWGHVVAATNRRPFGFDWEDWGRLDALEVLEHAERSLGTDPRRTCLTGHSMGGHGTWQLGAHYPDRFAAIAPSAGWISFWSYAGAAEFKDATPIEVLLRRAMNPSDTLALSRNYLHQGIYILHGDQDDNVPVEQARQMREHLAAFHPDVAYHEQPGAGHWWDGDAAPGADCVDWPPLFDFFRSRALPASHEVRHVEFVTANPAISATCHWVTIEQQERSLDFSRVDLHVDPDGRRIHGTTANVARLTLTLGADSSATGGDSRFLLDPDRPLHVELDDERLADVPWPAGGRLRLEHRQGGWRVVPATDSPGLRWQKGPHRDGPFKRAFEQRVVLVYGTKGTAAENAWALVKARYDAETFWYRGNGAFDVVADVDFNALGDPDRNVVLYGNADTNSAWRDLLREAPVSVRRDGVRIGDREITADDLAVLLVYPRPGSDRALVGVVGGTGPPGMRLTERLPYFVSGVAYPDWIVLGTDVLRDGTAGIRGAGFFSNDWQIDPAQSAWREAGGPRDAPTDHHGSATEPAPADTSTAAERK